MYNTKLTVYYFVNKGNFNSHYEINVSYTYQTSILTKDQNKFNPFSPYVFKIGNASTNKALKKCKLDICSYRKSSIRSRLCIILDPKIPRLVLEALQKLWLLVRNFFKDLKDDLLKTPKTQKKPQSFDDIQGYYRAVWSDLY